MSDPTAGGRGKKAPYQTTHYRIPEPTKPIVEMLSSKFKQVLGSKNDPLGEKLLNRIENAILETEQLKKVNSLLDELEMLQNELSELKSNSKQIQQILEEALTLKSNAGGAIKGRIREAIHLIKN